MNAPAQERPLDGFESRLLAELLSVVEEQQAMAPPRRPRRRLLVAAGVGVAAAGLVVGAAILPGGGPSSAYAVTAGANGEVHVQIHRLEDAAGLQRALADKGVQADVTYLPYGQQCAPGRYVEAPSHPGGGMTIGVHDDGVDLLLNAGTVADGETLVFQFSKERTGTEVDGVAQSSIGVAVGPVGPCRPIAAPPLPAE